MSINLKTYRAIKNVERHLANLDTPSKINFKDRLADQLLSKISQMTKTPNEPPEVSMSDSKATGKVRKIGRNYTVSKSAGFISTKKRTKRKLSKKTKKRLRKKIKKLNNAVSLVVETNNQFSGPNALYVGHGTFDILISWNQFGLAFLKYIFSKIGIHMQNENSSISTFGNTSNYILEIRYFLSVDQTIPNKLVVDLPQTNSWNTNKNLFLTQLENIFKNGNINWPDIEFIDFCLKQPSTAEQMFTESLKNMRFHNYVKTSLKVQNRTIAEGNFADEVDNVPLYGRTFLTKGTGFQLYDPLREKFNAQLAIKPARGCFKQADNDLPEGMKEPPRPHMFTKTYKTDKLKLDPGEIKTSNLKSTFSYTFQGIFKIYQKWHFSSLKGFDAGDENRIPIINPQIIMPLGVSRVLCLEKMIGTDVGVFGSDRRNLSIGFENNHYQSTKVTNWQSKYTVTKFIDQPFD